MPDGLKQPAVLLLLRSERGLLLIRREREPHRGLYVPIGGKIDPYEAPRDAAIREGREEAGVTVAEARPAGILTETSPTPYNWIVYVYAADVPAFDPPACPEGELSWVPDEDIPALPTPEVDRFIYEMASSGRFFALDARYDADVRLIRLTDEITGEEMDLRSQ